MVVLDQLAVIRDRKGSRTIIPGYAIFVLACFVAIWTVDYQLHEAYYVTSELMEIDSASASSSNIQSQTSAASVASVATTLESTELAKRESLGFFRDIPDSTWKRHKARFQLTQPNYDDSNKKEFERHSRHSNWFWANQFEPEFTCPHEFRLGKLGDGGKWICDPHRIPSDSCLIYSVGSSGTFEFEANALKQISKNCEIHTFDIFKSKKSLRFAEEADRVNALIYETKEERIRHNNNERSTVGVHFHHWGLGTPFPKLPNKKRFKEIMVALHHENRTIDIMKIDCEKCEYNQFGQWLSDWEELGMTVRQVQLEIHNSDLPGVVNLMKAFQKAGYVMFHKEANYLNEGKAIEAAFLLLSTDFQKNDNAGGA